MPAASCRHAMHAADSLLRYRYVANIDCDCLMPRASLLVANACTDAAGSFCRGTLERDTLGIELDRGHWRGMRYASMATASVTGCFAMADCILQTQSLEAQSILGSSNGDDETQSHDPAATERIILDAAVVDHYKYKRSSTLATSNRPHSHLSRLQTLRKPCSLGIEPGKRRLPISC